MVRVIVNNLYRPEVDETSIAIDENASDPVPTCSFVVKDNTSSIFVKEMNEVVVIDNDAYPQSPAHNLAVNPMWNPYTTSWTSNPQTNLTFSQNGGGGFIVTAANAANGVIATMSQTPALPNPVSNLLPAHFVTPGQKYMLSVYAQGNAATNIQAYLELDILDAGGNVILMQTNFETVNNSVQRFTVIANADPNTVSLQIKVGAFAQSGTNSGTITFTACQVEPMYFTSLGVSYPTPDCNTTQANCVVLPNGTTVRQKRLFTGWVTDYEYGNYVGAYRDITVNASGPAWMLDFRLQGKTYTSKTDSFIIQDMLNGLYSGLYSFNHLIAGLTYNSLALNRDTVRSIIDNFASSVGFRWTVDYYYDVWFLPPGYFNTGYTLADAASNPSAGQYTYYKYSYKADFTQPGNEMTVLENGGPNAILVGDIASRQTYGFIFDKRIDDKTISNDTDAYNRALAENITYSTPRIIIKLELDERASQVGIVPGNAIPITNSIEGYTSVMYIIQKVHIQSIGTDKTGLQRYLYQLELGDYNSDLISLLVRHRRILSQPATSTIVLGTETVLVVEPLGIGETHTP